MFCGDMNCFSLLNMIPASDRCSCLVTVGLFISQLNTRGRLCPERLSELSKNVRKSSASFLSKVKTAEAIIGGARSI
jgi:hypothetical protein